MPTARLFCARRMMCLSTSLAAVIIRSANSSATMTMYGMCVGICWRSLVVLRLDPLHQLLFAQLVVDADVPHAGAGQQVVPLLHLLHRPAEDRLGLPHVGHHRVHQVRQALVGAELDHLRVDHQHADLVGPAGHEHRDDDRVQADALARARAAGDQQVRQRGQIDDQRVARRRPCRGRSGCASSGPCRWPLP